MDVTNNQTIEDIVRIEREEKRIRDQLHYEMNQMRKIMEPATKLLDIVHRLGDDDVDLAIELSDIGDTLCSIADDHVERAREALRLLHEHEEVLESKMNEDLPDTDG